MIMGWNQSRDDDFQFLGQLHSLCHIQREAKSGQAEIDFRDTRRKLRKSSATDIKEREFFILKKGLLTSNTVEVIQKED